MKLVLILPTGRKWCNHDIQSSPIKSAKSLRHLLARTKGIVCIMLWYHISKRRSVAERSKGITSTLNRVAPLFTDISAGPSGDPYEKHSETGLDILDGAL